ncbi:signal peptidase I [Paenibacillus pasadenensis]|uniref:signal peptidase I n=1 Tax=Paenibacillus pasadenensis TaxID=217090 RepID=UPI002040888D|nr:signal peptidase I [Paenibacillus pasadenensis]MCM3745924.1 signal peptidase I [Paenibacillus pasadenensis]
MEPEPVSSGEQSRQRYLVPRWLELIAMLVLAILISLLVQQYAIAQTEVHNISMQTTLREGERLLENKLAYVAGSPRRQDIVIIYGPESELRLVKRVVGLPGETVTMKDGRLYIDGAPLREPYALGRTEPLSLKLPFTVPAGHVFVLGDNREYSVDSRELGPVRISSLEGKIIFRIWPFHQAGFVD